jgi:cobyrinic acid a,c-diamide synthase
MCGVLPVTARMTARLTLGYRDAVAASDSALAPAGLAVRGHEFHRTDVSLDGTVPPDGSASPAWTMGAGSEGFVRSGVHASYLHLHWAGRPGIAARLVEAAARGDGRGTREERRGETAHSGTPERAGDAA